MQEFRDLHAAVSETEAWIDDITHRLGWHDRERAYLVLLATLHALRDSLPRDEAVYIGAQLPPLLRGLYYEGWHPDSTWWPIIEAPFCSVFMIACIATPPSM